MSKLPNSKFKAERVNDAIQITSSLKRANSWEFRVLLISDVHCDNKGFKKSLLIKHLNEAKENGWAIIDNGDFFDCMGGKWDKRSNKADILPELQHANYFDRVIKYGADILRPYKENIVILSEGNHEVSIKERHETDLTERLIHELGGGIFHQKYTGWVRFVFQQGSNSYVTIMYRTHGTGGNAPVTKGVIQSARRQDMIDADIYISGHIHTEYNVARPRWYMDRACNIKIKTPVHQQIGTYKDSTGKTWEDMKGFSPPSLGGQWLIFTFDPTEGLLKSRFQPCQ